MQNILIIGATSAIAEATARLYAQRGDNRYLLARNEDRLATIAGDLKIRGANSTNYAQFDANQFKVHAKLIDTAFKKLGPLSFIR